MRKRSLGAILAVLASGPAFAADMPMYRPPPRYIPPPIISWTGFYAGVNAGYSWGVSPFIKPNQDVAMLRVGPPVESQIAATSVIAGGAELKASNDGFVGGMQVGFNWQAGDTAVVGIEADAQGFANVMVSSSNAVIAEVPDGGGMTISSFATGTRSLDYLGTVRFRLGWLATPTLLIYGTGGLAYGGIRGSYGVTQTLNTVPFAPFADATWSGSSSYATMRAGWTAGVGAEWMIMPGVTVKGEYLYYSLGAKSTPGYGILDPTATQLPAAWATITRATSRFDGQIVRAGINYLFTGYSSAPVTAAAPAGPIYARY